MRPAPELVERFRRDLDRLTPAEAQLGIAVSGGPDSLALLLLAAAARPGRVEAATVDHALRGESRAEAEHVAGICKQLDVPHSILTVKWRRKPETGIQERARTVRYALLAKWAVERQLRALLTGHQLEDQAETFMMRLARGAGVQGLGAIRPVSQLAGTKLELVRPLLRWRRAELEQLCANAGIEPVADPSNADEQFERVRVRQALGEADWLDSAAIARSATHLAEADAALDWAADEQWSRLVSEHGGRILFEAGRCPPEIRRRIVRRAILQLASEGRGELRGPEMDRVLAELAQGGRATLRGVLCTGGDQWIFIPAPNRTRPVDNLR